MNKFNFNFDFLRKNFKVENFCNELDYLVGLRSENFDNVFSKKDKGSFLLRLLSQIQMLFGNLGDEGGLFIVYGRKKR